MSPSDAFTKLWEFIEGLGLDQPAENDLKYALCVLGRDGKFPEHLVRVWAANQDELEAKFFLQMKYAEVEPCRE